MLVQQAFWWLSQLSLCVSFWESCNVCIICLRDGPSVLETFWTPLSMSFYALTSFWFGIICLSDSDFDFAYSGSSWGSVAVLLLLSSCRALSLGFSLLDFSSHSVNFLVPGFLLCSSYHLYLLLLRLSLCPRILDFFELEATLKSDFTS